MTLHAHPSSLTEATPGWTAVIRSADGQLIEVVHIDFRPGATMTKNDIANGLLEAVRDRYGPIEEPDVLAIFAGRHNPVWVDPPH